MDAARPLRRGGGPDREDRRPGRPRAARRAAGADGGRRGRAGRLRHPLPPRPGRGRRGSSRARAGDRRRPLCRGADRRRRRRDAGGRDGRGRSRIGRDRGASGRHGGPRRRRGGRAARLAGRQPRLPPGAGRPGRPRRGAGARGSCRSRAHRDILRHRHPAGTAWRAGRPDRGGRDAPHGHPGAPSHPRGGGPCPARARRSVARRRLRRGRFLRDAQRLLPRGRSGDFRGAPDGPPGPMERGADGGLPVGHAVAPPIGRCGPGPRCRPALHGARARRLGRGRGLLRTDVHASYDVQPAGAGRMLPDPRDPRSHARHGGQPDAYGALSRRRASRGDLRDRAHGRHRRGATRRGSGRAAAPQPDHARADAVRDAVGLRLRFR